MTARRITSLGTLAVTALAFLAITLVGCESEPASNRSEVAGARPVPTANPTPTRAVARGATATLVPTPRGTALVPPAPSRTPVPAAISQALSNVYANVDGFQGVLTVTADSGGGNPVNMIVRQWFKQPNKIKLEILRTSTKQVPVGTTVVYDGRKLSIFEPGIDRLVESLDPSQISLFLSIPQVRLIPALQLFQVQQFISSLDSQAAVTLVGSETVADRTTTVVDITPNTTPPRFQVVRLWLDEQTRAPLRLDARGSDGTSRVSIDYSQLDRRTAVSDEAFSLAPPVRTEVISWSADTLATIAGFQPVSLPEAQAKAGLPVLQPASPPAGASLQSVRHGNLDGSQVVAFFYGTPQAISAALVEERATLRLPVLRAAKSVTLNGFTAEVHEAQGVVVIDWVNGDTFLTLVSTLPRDQAMEIARSAK